MSNDLEKQLKDAIKKHKFGTLEMHGFRMRPDLALLAGAAIGYDLAMDEAITSQKEQLKAINEMLQRKA